MKSREPVASRADTRLVAVREVVPRLAGCEEFRATGARSLVPLAASRTSPLAAVRRTIRDEGGPMPTTAPMDELLDERLAHRGRAGEDAAADS